MVGQMMISRTILIGMLLLGNIFSQECSDCFVHRIALYDLENTVPRPTVEAEIVQWFGLFYGSAGMRNYVMNLDPKKGCNFYLDGALMQGESGSIDNSLAFGMEYTNLAPAGCIKSSDYLMTGVVAKTVSGYSITVELQASWSREVVATQTVSFNTPGEAMDAGKNAANAIGSVSEKILAFERKKRATDVEVAMRDKWTKTSGPDIELIPAKRSASMDEEIDVEIKMIDCEDFPLANRVIDLAGDPSEGLNASTGGKFTTTSLTTGADGVAHAKFKCGKVSGFAILRVNYQHHKPHGRPGVFFAEKTIVIEKPAVDYWEISVQATTTYSYRHTADKESNSQWDSYNMFSTRGGMTAIIKNTGKPNRFNFDTDADVPEVVSWHGTGCGSETRVDKSYFADVLQSASWGNTSQTAMTDTGSFTLKFHYDSLLAEENPGVTIGYFEASFPLKKMFNRSIRGCTYTGVDKGCSSDNSEATDRTAITVTCDNEQGVITQTDSGYTISHNFSESTTKDYVGKEYETTKYEFNARIRPYNLYKSNVNRTMINRTVSDCVTAEIKKGILSFHTIQPVKNLSFLLYNCAGKKIVSRTFSSFDKNIQFSVKTLPPGLYIVKYASDSRQGQMSVLLTSRQ